MNAPARTGAAMNRHRSTQSVATPWDLIRAVEGRFGRLGFDLAADATNTKVPGSWLGPGGLREDSLAADWAPLLAGRLGWLNPEYADIQPWAAKAASERDAGARIAMLVPASVDSLWFSQHVLRKALVLALQPRVPFIGHKHGYPKPLVLCVYGPGVVAAFDCWRWKP